MDLPPAYPGQEPVTSRLNNAGVNGTGVEVPPPYPGLPLNGNPKPLTSAPSTIPQPVAIPLFPDYHYYQCPQCQNKFQFDKDKAICVCPRCHEKLDVGDFAASQGATTVRSGLIWFLAGFLVTLVTVFSGMRFFIVWFGPMIYGLYKISTGMMMLRMKKALPIAAPTNY
uniref:Phosphatidylinositol-4,5-bisphosphate 4-phosphatase n=1 Tax=Plectus sambesii TaxID=2011161 RepID=A0A914VEQ8_9BILA